ncbi:Asp170ser mutant of vanillyl-alcohol oxidase [Meredithblackwellia eburnea MCA 4105]
MTSAFPNPASAEGRPRTINRPTYFGSQMDPGVFLEPNSNREEGKREVKLPPGVDRSTFEEGIQKLRGLIGDEWVELNDVPLHSGDYMAPPLSHDPYYMLDQDTFASCGAVYPADTEDVVKIVKWANEFKVPLWPISIGRNLGYGGSAPRLPGSLIVHLGRRMNKVLQVDPENSSCFLEPGVSYFDLYEHLHKVGLGEQLWVDVPDLGGGSVIGNALDRGVGYTPYGDHWAQHCGMEVVMPTGEIIRTGMMAMPDSGCSQAFNYGFGPQIDGMFTQANLGIVTKMGMWLMPSPGGCYPFMFTFPEHSDLVQLVDLMRPLMLNRQLHNIPGLRLGIYDCATYTTRAEAFPGMEGKPITPEMEREMLKKRGAAAWYFYAAVYGPESHALPHLEFLKSVFLQVPGAKYYTRDDVPANHYLHDRAKVFRWNPHLPRTRLAELDPHGTLFFSPISPVVGKDALAQVEMCKYRFDEYGFDFFDVLYVGPREVHNIVILLFDKTNPEQRRKAMKCMQVMIEDAAKLGYGEYRTHIALQDLVMSTYNYNDSSLLRLHEKMKDDLDPNGILAPGRSGVWPSKYRNSGFQIGLNEVHAETPNPVLERLLAERAKAPRKRTYGTDEVVESQRARGTQTPPRL